MANKKTEQKGGLTRFKPGHPGGPGRPKGVPNSTTVTIKQALLKSFSDGNGVEWLKNLMRADAKTYATLLLRLIPQEQAAADDDTGNPVARDPDDDIV